MPERLHSNHEKTRGVYKSRGLHKAFNKGGIPLLVESSKSPQIKKCVCGKYNCSFCNAYLSGLTFGIFYTVCNSNLFLLCLFFLYFYVELHFKNFCKFTECILSHLLTWCKHSNVVFRTYRSVTFSKRPITVIALAKIDIFLYMSVILSC